MNANTGYFNSSVSNNDCFIHVFHLRIHFVEIVLFLYEVQIWSVISQFKTVNLWRLTCFLILMMYTVLSGEKTVPNVLKSSYWYFNDVLFLNNPQFEEYVNTIYPSEELKQIRLFHVLHHIIYTYTIYISIRNDLVFSFVLIFSMQRYDCFSFLWCICFTNNALW